MNRTDFHLLLFGRGALEDVSDPQIPFSFCPSDQWKYRETNGTNSNTMERKSPPTPVKRSEPESWLHDLPPYISR